MPIYKIIRERKIKDSILVEADTPELAASISDSVVTWQPINNITTIDPWLAPTDELKGSYIHTDNAGYDYDTKNSKI